MKLLEINPNNRKYYSEEFIKGFECGVERQFNADMEEKTTINSTKTTITDGDLISRTDLLKDIADLKKSLWFNDGKYNKDLFRRNSYVARKEAVEIIEDLCIKKFPSAEK